MGILRRFHLKNVVGRNGEDVAARFLKKTGFSILERNYRNASGRALGEIDIVAREGAEVVFVEVKALTLRTGREELPESAITAEKLHRLSRIAQAYLREAGSEDVPYRFDAVSVVFHEAGKEPDVRHLRNIFL